MERVGELLDNDRAAAVTHLQATLEPQRLHPLPVPQTPSQTRPEVHSVAWKWLLVAAGRPSARGLSIHS